MTYRTPNNIQHRGDIHPLSPIEARVVVELAMAAPDQCLDVSHHPLVGTYKLRSGETLVLRASILVANGRFALAFDGGSVDPRDVQEVNEIHNEIIRLVPIIADLMPTLGEVA